ncbi:MAG: Uncharacterized protein E1N59_2283 [Puniceicoccaceae bacterium 5H]|nr:MAG: Uncharacterized protein E1N59_2283 [Puniceicoccaceae bacterium 5H]
MDLSATQFGLIASGALALLSAYYLILRIHALQRESPDPKLTYATRQDLERLRNEVHQLRRDTQHDLTELDNKRSQSLGGVYDLIRKNSEHIAALIAQMEMLSVKH